jgi:hypothetical protein
MTPAQLDRAVLTAAASEATRGLDADPSDPWHGAVAREVQRRLAVLDQTALGVVQIGDHHVTLDRRLHRALGHAMAARDAVPWVAPGGRVAEWAELGCISSAAARKSLTRLADRIRVEGIEGEALAARIDRLECRDDGGVYARRPSVPRMTVRRRK